MATVLEDRNELWDVLEPLIPPVEVPAEQGRRPVPDRVCFNAIVFVLVTGITWAHLPREPGCSGTTGWRWLRDGQTGGAWERLHKDAARQAQRRGAID